jgi:hypothetical protein
MAHAPEVFQSKVQNVAAVVGENLAAGDGVFGIGHGATGRGVVGTSDQQNGVTGVSTTGTGVWGVNTKNGNGVFGEAQQGGAGVYAISQSGEGIHGETHSDGFAAIAGFNLSQQGTGAGIFGQTASPNGFGGFFSNQGGGAGVFGTSQSGEGIHGETHSDVFAAIAGFYLSQQGTGAAIFGQANSPNGFAGFFSGKVEITGDLVVRGDICLPRGADFAESFRMAEDGIDPGTVVVISGEDTVRPSRTPYDPHVAGVVSGAGPFRPGVILSDADAVNRCPLALAGRAYCKVDASYAPIAVGDLLTTSATPGYAMKAADPTRVAGAVLGKALRAMDSGSGLIPILVVLQ